MLTSRAAAAIIIVSLSIAVTDSQAAGIGTVTEQTGPTEIQRNKDVIPSNLNSDIESNDSVVTARARAQITFKDDTKVQITEQSKLVIDDFVYDPNKSDAGKIGLKIAMGTARYASGQIAKNNPQQVKIETPTATIAVRGTDFSMTVDELGRSLIVLLPSCPVGFKDIDKDCKTGVIDVTTDAGTVTLNKPFQATSTASREQNPSKSAILKLTFDQINNMMILSPPKKDDTAEPTRTRTALDINFLDKDMLKFTDLDTNYLTAGGNMLDVNMLDAVFLFNILEYMNAALLDNMLSAENQMLPGYKANKAVGLYYYTVDTNLTLYRTSTQSFAQVTVDKETQSTLILNQDDFKLTQVVNRTNGTVINIKQSK
jgi:FecR protein